MSITEASPLEVYATAIQSLLVKARELKPSGEIEPALAPEELDEGIEKIEGLSMGLGNQNYAAIETACREIFYKLLASTSIEDPAFGVIWNLFDVVSTLSDRELCDPALVFWLIEELLDSQTIDGCRIVFDYLDSRRDRLTSRHFKQKNLIILRSCNELLRRLSRAEDTVFCGRVFIFLFQSFPLGDKSSVNLRGEYHVENVTTFEDLPPKEVVTETDGMDVDQDEEKPEVVIDDTSKEDAATTQENTNQVKTVKFDAQETKFEEEPMDSDSLYATFWSLQDSFSQPTRLFDDSKLQSFKRGLRSTMRKFREVQQKLPARGPTKVSDESKRGVKRKRGGQDDDLSSAFNPKYLTSRDLFDLEINDPAFRRHILVQSLIIVDFLLSLTSKAKKKLDQMVNRSVLYAYTLNEENTKWAINTRNDIAAHLQQGSDGKFYYRMVDTVLSRDKNWTHWKAENCPPIGEAPVAGEDFSEAMQGAQKTFANKRLRSTPLGTLDLKFLTETGGDKGMEKLKNPERYTIPTAESFERPIADDQFEIEMGSTAEEKQLAEDARASKLWRTLRIASKDRLSRFDKIDDGKNLDALFRPEPDESSQKTEISTEEGKEITGDDSERKEKVEAEGGEDTEKATVNGTMPALDGAAEERKQETPVAASEQKESKEQVTEVPQESAAV